MSRVANLLRRLSGLLVLLAFCVVHVRAARAAASEEPPASHAAGVAADQAAASSVRVIDPTAPIVLSNGLRLVMRERRSTPLVGIDLFVQAGAREERPDEEGCAHFIEHVLFKGTTTRVGDETDVAIENLGATLNAGTGPDYMHIYTTVASIHLAEALAILADVVRNATLPEAEIERERGVILDELAGHASDPAACLVDRLYAHAFPGRPYAHSPLGTERAIRELHRETLFAFYQRLYSPHRCTVALAGDLTEQQALQETARAFGDWQPRAASQAPLAERPVRPAPSAAGDPGTVTDDRPLPYAGIAAVGPPATDQRLVAAAQVTAAILGDAEGYGRLGQGSVAKLRGIARFNPRRDPSLFTVTATAESGRGGADTEVELETVLAGLEQSPPSMAEIDQAKARVLSRARFDVETDAGFARAIGYADCIGGDPPEAGRRAVEALTPSDLQVFWRVFLDPKTLIHGAAPSGAARQGPAR